MRVSKDQMRENKRRILAAAGRLFRERGFAAVSVKDVMQAADMTHGGFYGHFESKDDLIAQALAGALEEAREASRTLSPTPSAVVARYLTPSHRDNHAEGCPLAALATEAIRQPGMVRAEMTASLERQIDALAKSLKGAEGRNEEAGDRRAAIGVWASMVGALILSRVSTDPALSDEILNETRSWLESTVDGTSP